MSDDDGPAFALPPSFFKKINFRSLDGDPRPRPAQARWTTSCKSSKSTRFVGARARAPALAAFAARALNRVSKFFLLVGLACVQISLARIESRPSTMKPKYDYDFYVDFHGAFRSSLRAPAGSFFSLLFASQDAPLTRRRQASSRSNCARTWAPCRVRCAFSRARRPQAAVRSPNGRCASCAPFCKASLARSLARSQLVAGSRAKSSISTCSRAAF